MATYVETKIERALIGHLGALTLTPALPIAFPNSAFDQTTTGKDGYLRATHVPNTVSQITLGDLGKNRFLGIFQIDVMWPKNTGYVTSGEIAGAVAAHFKRGTDIALDGITVRIIKPPRIAQALQSDPFVQIPVMVQYQADADNPS